MIELEVPHYRRKDNDNPMLSKKSAIVIHDTGGKTAMGTINWFMQPESQVSSHYLVDKDGKIYHLVPDEYIAWHAGTSVLHNVEDVNAYSLGIELVDDNDGDPYPAEQIDSLINLCAKLCLENRIPLNRVVGHQDVAVPKGRKVDPGKDFPWFEFLNSLGAAIGERELDGDDSAEP